MTITGGSALSKDEMDRMMREAEAFANEDKSRREMAEARNMGDNLLYQTEKTLKEHGEKLAEGDRKEIEDAMAEIKEALGGEDVERIKTASERLSTASHKLAEQIYSRSQSDSSASADGSATSEEDEIVDAEVVEDGAS